MYRILAHHTPDQAALLRAHNDVAEEKMAACYRYGIGHPISRALGKWQRDLRDLMVELQIAKF